MEIPRHWILKAQRYRLEGSACPTCGQVTFPPRPVCPRCTAQPVRVADCGLFVIPTSNRTFDTVSSKGGYGEANENKSSSIDHKSCQ